MEMVMPVNYVEMTDDEMMYVDGGGFVGVNINMNYKKWNSNNAFYAGLAAGAVVAMAGSSLTGAIGTGFAFIAGGMVQHEVEKSLMNGRYSVRVGINVPLVSWSTTVSIACGC